MSEDHSSMKVLLRKNVKQAISALSIPQVQIDSEKVAAKLINHPLFSLSKTICIYLSMPKEIQTDSILKCAFEMNKKVVIPKVVGKLPTDMILLEVTSLEQIMSFPKSNWGIPEPPEDFFTIHDDKAECGTIDTIIVPGVAFDKHCGRIGHGKGYYDSCISRIVEANLKAGNAPPMLIGVALDEQVVDAVPMDDHDKFLDYVITPSEIFSRQPL